ncbi:hypothetical protein ACSXAB_16195 (plasmid) [Clostridium perfringens]
MQKKSSFALIYFRYLIKNILEHGHAVVLWLDNKDSFTNNGKIEIG